MVIAVSAISGVVESLPRKLQQLEQQFTLSRDDQRYVGCLQDELELVRGAFEQYSKLENPTEFTREWVHKVREVAYDIEEFVDQLVHGAGDAGSHVAAGDGTLLSRLVGYLSGNIKGSQARRRSISDELKLHGERLHEQILEQPATFMARSTARPGGVDCSNVDLQLATSQLLVGVDEAREEVTNMVADGGAAESVKVVYIVGMAGAGKTTLAKEVYHQLGKREHFHHRVFVSVGRAADLCAALKAVLSNLGSAENGGEEAADIDELLKLKCLVTKELQHKRYFVVLDDLWSTEAWSAIKSCFPNNNLGSRIVTTTRIEAVAKACCSSPNDCVFKIPLLNEINSEMLFFGRVFGSKNECPPDLRDISMQILRKCCGLPLAIVNIAAYLRKGPSVAAALRTFQQDLQSKSYLHGMKEVFDHSYSDAPTQLKTCLLYLSIFPENYEIRRQRLIRRWIAEGFIDEHSTNKEETATSYFNELINRSLIQPVQLDYDGNARSCRVHPVMVDFIVCKSMEEKFVTLLHPGRRQEASPNNGAIRWLSLCDTVRDKSTDLSHARSFTLFGHVGGMPKLAAMKMLRVLDLERCEGPLHRSLDALPELFLLRYLSLRGTDVVRLPSRIGELSNLETLDIRSTGIQELPPSTVQLHKLVNLLAGMVPLPRGIRKMRSLQTFSFADIGKSSKSALRELGDLIKLRELAIFCSHQERQTMVLVLKTLAAHSLRSLIVACTGGCWMESSHRLPLPPRLSLQRFMIDESALRRVPGQVASSSVNLVEMDISLHQLGARDLMILEGLASLLRLCLCLVVVVPQGRLAFRKGGFPRLKEMCFRCRDLPSLSFEAGALPMLERLELNFQGHSEEPAVAGVERLPSLKHAIIAFPHEDVGTKVVTEVKKAASAHPNHPDVVVKTGKDVSSVGNGDFEELDPLSREFAVSPVEAKSNIQSTHKYLIDMVQVIATCSFSQAPKSTAATSLGLFGHAGMLLIFIHQYLRMLSHNSRRFEGLDIYMDTVVTVVIAFALLVLINFRYCILVPFPICLVGFVIYLCNEIWSKGRLQQYATKSQGKPRNDTRKNEETVATAVKCTRSADNLQNNATDAWQIYLNRDTKKIEELVRTAVAPYCMLAIVAQHGDSSPALSHFMLFSCYVLGILALMYFKLAAEVSPLLTPALEWILRAYIVMLLITAHTMAAEWLGEVSALICIPELISGLLWFATLLDNGLFNRVVDKVTMDEDGSICNSAVAVLAGLTLVYYRYEEEFQVTQYTQAMVACSIAGCMPYLSVWMISRWPGSIPGSEKAIQVLKFLAKVCLSASCLMLIDLLTEDPGLRRIWFGRFY
ncbi:hypothetical protein ACP70R_031575 [Stipagrostis hirtigluma subsp. patula]